MVRLYSCFMASLHGVICLEKMIPILTDAGYRVIAPDMIGFGKSDKYISTSMYTHQMHVDTMKELIIN